MLFKECVIASTFSDKTNFDLRRTPYIYTKEAIVEINKQFHILKDKSEFLDVILQTPLINYVTVVLPKEEDTVSKQNGVIGKLVNCETRINNQLDTIQLIGTIDIHNDIIANTIHNNKKDVCFFTLIAHNPEVSLKTVLLTEGDDHNVAYLYPPLKIVGLSLGTRRQSSNPYLCID